MPTPAYRGNWNTGNTSAVLTNGTGAIGDWYTITGSSTIVNFGSGPVNCQTGMSLIYTLASQYICAPIALTATVDEMIGNSSSGGGGGGTGTVVNFASSGTSDLFTTMVTSPTVAPNLSFVPISRSPNLFYASQDNITGLPLWRTLAVRDFNSGISASSSTFWRGDGTWVSLGLSAYVPYTGATTDVALGTHNLSATNINVNTPTSTTGILNINGELQAISNSVVPITLINPLADFEAASNTYVQINLRNASSGATASSDFIATADNGTDVSNYIDMGINASGWSSAGWTINGPGDGYLYTQGGNLSIGAALNKYFSIFTGGTLSANQRFKIDGVGQTTFTLGSDATGDVWARNSSGFFTRIPIGSAASVFMPFGGYPAWIPITGAISINSSGSTSIVSYSGLVEEIAFNDITSAIANNTYTLDLYAEFGYSINEMRILATSGTCTASLQIGGTPVTGISAVSVSNTIALASASGANTLVVGNRLTLVLSSTSSLNNLQGVIKTTRT